MTKKIYSVETQFLSVQVPLSIALNAEGEVQGLMQDCRPGDMRADGLRPLILYSLTLPAYGQSLLHVADIDKPIAISKFLSECWSVDTPVKGLPQVLEISKKLAELDDGLVSWVRANRVLLSVCSSNTKALVSFARAAKHQVRQVWNWSDKNYSRKSLPLEAVNQGLWEYALFSGAISHLHFNSMEALTFEAFSQTRSARFDSLPPTKALDWRPSGLTVSTQSTPPKEVQMAPDVDDLSESDYPPPGTKELLACWPVSLSMVAKRLDIDRKSLEWYLSDKAHMDTKSKSRLYWYLGMERVDGYYELGGEHLLVARGKTQSKKLYDILSRGGDLDDSFEVICPDLELGDFRFLVFQRAYRSSNVMMFKRGGPECKLLDDRDALIGFTGERVVPRSVWTALQDLVIHVSEITNRCELWLRFNLELTAWQLSEARKDAGRSLYQCGRI